MIDPNLFKDFLSGEGASEEYMRDALHIEQDLVSGDLYSLFDDQENLADYSLLDDDNDETGENEDEDDVDDVDDDDDVDDVDDVDDSLLLESMLDELLKKAEHVERTSAEKRTAYISFGSKKICATRHGCTGATNCDYSYGAPIGR